MEDVVEQPARPVGVKVDGGRDDHELREDANVEDELVARVEEERGREAEPEGLAPHEQEAHEKVVHQAGVAHYVGGRFASQQPTEVRVGMSLGQPMTQWLSAKPIGIDLGNASVKVHDGLEGSQGEEIDPTNEVCNNV